MTENNAKTMLFKCDGDPRIAWHKILHTYIDKWDKMRKMK